MIDYFAYEFYSGNLKTSSERSDVIIVGSGIPAICGAISSARQGAKVSIVDPACQLGGCHDHHNLFPFRSFESGSFVDSRESGLIDEIYQELWYHNREGNSFGLSRTLKNLIDREERVNLHLGYFLSETRENHSNQSIESLFAIRNDLSEAKLLRAKYFIDCSEDNCLSKMVGAIESIRSDLYSIPRENSLFDPSMENFAIIISIEKSLSDIPFITPDSMPQKWEDNSILAKLDLMESLEAGIEGSHRVEWKGKVQGPKMNPEMLAWCVWDYLKNRSPISGKLGKFFISRISEKAIFKNSHRGESLKNLDARDILSGKSFPDSIAISKIPFPQDKSLVFSKREKIQLPHAFEIPLKSLKSAKKQNLFWIGDNALNPNDECIFTGNTPTLSMMACACGVSAAILSKNATSFSHSSFYKKVQRALIGSNQQVGLQFEKDKKDKILKSNISASSTLNEFTVDQESKAPVNFYREVLLPIPITSSELTRVYLRMRVPSSCSIQYQFLEGSSYNSSLPGKPLYSGSLNLQKNSGTLWQSFELKIQIENPGWHFLKLQADQKFGVVSQHSPPTGICYLEALSDREKKLTNPASEYKIVTAQKNTATIGPALRTEPSQSVYSPENLSNSCFRPNHLPNLWISQPTNFKYAEFVEFNWKERVGISRLEICFDGNFNLPYPSASKDVNSGVMMSIVKDYNVFHNDQNGHSQKLLEVRNNRLSFRVHEFAEIHTNSIEIEVLSTHGLNRAQIFQIRVF